MIHSPIAFFCEEKNRGGVCFLRQAASINFALRGLQTDWHRLHRCGGYWQGQGVERTWNASAVAVGESFQDSAQIKSTSCTREL